jgi:predicted DsbA family dithiol-disulfide isomerase
MKPMQIDVVSDVVCPWCYVGLRRLDEALELFRQSHPQQPPVVVRWHPFQLNPDLDPAGMARQDYVKAKFGDRSGAIYDRVKGVGLSVGIEFNFEGIARQPNTLRPHALIAVAQEADAQNRLVQALFDAYFIENLDLTQADQLARIARDAGLQESAIDQALNDEALHRQIQAADDQARTMGITGVPFFIFNGEYAVSGAQEAQHLLGAMEQAMQVDEP